LIERVAKGKAAEAVPLATGERCVQGPRCLHHLREIAAVTTISANPTQTIGKIRKPAIGLGCVGTAAPVWAEGSIFDPGARGLPESP